MDMDSLDAPGPLRLGWRVRSPPPASICCAAPCRCRRQLRGCGRQRGPVRWPSHNVTPTWLTRIYVWQLWTNIGVQRPVFLSDSLAVNCAAESFCARFTAPSSR